MIHKGILQTTELRLVVKPYLQITTTSLLGLGLLGGWAGPNWLTVLAIATALMATIIWVGRRARLWGAKPVYVYASAVINLAASAVIVLITGGARSPFWLLFLVGAIASGMSFRGRAGSNLNRLNAATATLALLGPELMAWPLDGPGLALVGMEVLTLFMSEEMIRKITSLLLESRETLRESEERYRMLIDTARDVIFSLATDGTFTSLNPSFETFTGWSRAEWLGHSFEGLIAEADRPRALDLFNRVLLGEALRAIRLRVHTHAGATLVVELNLSPQTQDGHAVGLLGIARDMTEEQRAEDALQASEKRFRALIENSTDAVSLLNANGTILYASPATTRVLGYTADEMVGRNVFELLHPDDMPNVTALFAQLLQSPGAIVTAQARYRHQAGEWRWYEGTGHNLLAEQSVQAVVVNYRDITERKRAEETLQEAEARYRTLVEHMPAVMYVDAPDEAGTSTYVSPQVEALLGYSLAEWEQDPYFWHKCVYPADYERAVGIIHATLSQGRASEEYRMLARDGRAVWVRDESVLIRDAAGQPRLVQGFLVDVTDRRQAKMEVARLLDETHRRAEELSALYHITYDLTVQTDVNSLLQTIAQRASALLGIKESGIFLFDPVKQDLEIVASTNDIVPIGFRLKLGEGMAGRVAESRQPMIVEDYSQWTGRSERLKDAPFASNLQVPMLYQGELIGVLDVYDIHRAGEPLDALKRKFTEADANLLSLFASAAAGAVYSARLHQQVQRHAEELEQRVAERTRDLVEANRRLTELDQLKSKFITDMSHELRTPVTNLSLSLGLLERGRPEKQRQYLTVLKGQIGRLVNLVQDITNVSDLELFGLAAAFGTVDLNAVVSQVATAFESRAEAAGLALIFEPDPDLPPVRGARDQLSRAVANLLTNAINYSHEGLVRVSTFRSEDSVCLQVQDTGTGIEPEDVPHVFERFYRGQSVSHIPGTGLGLAVVDEIVRLHGGTVAVESRIGEGSTFTVRLPCYKTNDE